MSKILFLYTDASEKANLLLCEEALKAVLRKFRKSATVSFLRLDLSPVCRTAMKNLLAEKAAQCDCILFSGSESNINEETDFFRECFGIYSAQYFSSGKCICFPVSAVTASESEEAVRETVSTDISSIGKTAEIAIFSAHRRKKRLLLCTDSKKESERIIYNELVSSMSGACDCETESLDINEILFLLMREVPAFDVILCTQEYAHIIAMHINALNSFPSAYSVYHGKNVRLYKREALAYEELSNLSYASLLIACGNMLENELGLQSAGAHLRKSAAHSLEKCCYADRSDFQKHLILEINTPIRNRKVNTNENNN